jgi:hypothetical protein
MGIFCTRFSWPNAQRGAVTGFLSAVGKTTSHRFERIEMALPSHLPWPNASFLTRITSVQAFTACGKPYVSSVSQSVGLLHGARGVSGDIPNPGTYMLRSVE